MLAMTACGKKGDPAPARLIMPTSVSDLQAGYGERGVILSWTMPAQKSDIARVRIFRSELITAGDACEGCPRQFGIISEITGKDLKWLVKGQSFASFTDSKIYPGRLYSYRVVLCDRAEFCSEPSNMAEIKVE